MDSFNLPCSPYVRLYRFGTGSVFPVFGSGQKIWNRTENRTEKNRVRTVRFKTGDTETVVNRTERKCYDKFHSLRSHESWSF